MKAKFCSNGNCIGVRGVKTFKCLKCGKEGSNYSNGVEICHDCIDKNDLCAICGKPIQDIINVGGQSEELSYTNQVYLEQIRKELRKELLLKLDEVPTVHAQYEGKQRPCIDIAVAMDIVRGKSWEQLTEEEKDAEIVLSIKNQHNKRGDGNNG